MFAFVKRLAEVPSPRPNAVRSRPSSPDASHDVSCSVGRSIRHRSSLPPLQSAVRTVQASLRGYLHRADLDRNQEELPARTPPRVRTPTNMNRSLRIESDDDDDDLVVNRPKSPFERYIPCCTASIAAQCHFDLVQINEMVLWIARSQSKRCLLVSRFVDCSFRSIQFWA